MRKNTKYHYQNYTLVKNPDQYGLVQPKINEPLKRKFDQVFNQLKGKKSIMSDNIQEHSKWLLQEIT